LLVESHDLETFFLLPKLVLWRVLYIMCLVDEIKEVENVSRWSAVRLDEVDLVGRWRW